MIAINPYLNFLGNTEDAMNFYKSVFDVEFSAFQRFNESPGHERMPKQEQQMIMHASLPMGKHNSLMATDALESMGMTITPGNNFYIQVSTENEEETDRLFNGLSAGGKIEIPLNKTFWGSYCGMCQDKFGIQWMINYDMNQKA
ncbi:MAG TPA: VOC family protein [Mucilaginibacter sp.]|jgi:PhnB protein